MSQENVEIVRRHLEARGEGLSALLKTLDPDIEWDLSHSASPYRGVYRGHAGVQQLWDEFSEAWSQTEWTLEEALPIGDDSVVATVVVSGRGKGSGVGLQSRGGGLYTVRLGKIVQFQLFQTKAEALEAVGLRE